MHIQVPNTEKNQENKQITQEHKKDQQNKMAFENSLKGYAQNFDPKFILSKSDLSEKEISTMINTLKLIQQKVANSEIPGEKQNV